MISAISLRRRSRCGQPSTHSNKTMQLFDECRDGLILCKLINDSVPDTIDTLVLNIPTARKALNASQITENNNIVIKAIGCSVVNIGSSDIAEGSLA